MQTFSNSPAPFTPSVALNDLFQEILKVDPASLDDAMTMNDVALWDSLRHMELIVAVEQKFGLELSFDEISTMQSIGAIRTLVTSKTST